MDIELRNKVVNRIHTVLTIVPGITISGLYPGLTSYSSHWKEVFFELIASGDITVEKVMYTSNTGRLRMHSKYYTNKPTGSLENVS